MPLNRNETQLLKAIGRKVQSARIAAGLTQEGLAEKADLHARTLQKIEAGDINILITTVDRLKKALGASWEDLLG